MNRRKTLILLGLLVIGIICTYQFEYLGEKKGAEKERREKSVLSLDPEKIEKVAVTFEGSTVEIGLEQGRWMITSPVKARADEYVINDLISAASRQEIVEIVDSLDKVTLSDFGLEHAYARIDFFSSGGPSPQTVWFGDSTPTWGKVYARSSETDSVFTTRSGSRQGMVKTLFQLREKKIFEDSGVDIKSIRYTRGGIVTEIEKDSEGKWNITSPIKELADQDKVETFTKKILNARASKFIDEPIDERKAGLNPPLGEVTFLFSDGRESLSLLIGKEDREREGVYVKREATRSVALLREGFFNDFPETADDFRDRRIFRLERDNISKVVWKREGERTEMSRDEEGRWQMISPEESRLDQGEVFDYFRDLEKAEADGFVETVPPGTGKIPALEISAWEASKHSDLFFYRSGDKIYGKSSLLTGFFTLSEEVFERLDKRPDEFFNRRVFDMLHVEVGKIAVTKDEKTFLFKKGKGKWMMLKPEKKEAILRKIGAFVSSLVNLEYVSRETGLQAEMEPLATVSVESLDGKKRIQLNLFGFNEDETLIRAKVKGEKSLYLLPKRFMEDISTGKLEDLTV